MVEFKVTVSRAKPISSSKLSAMTRIKLALLGSSTLPSPFRLIYC